MLRKLSQSLEVSQRKLNNFGKSFYENVYYFFFISYNISICNRTSLKKIRPLWFIIEINSLASKCFKPGVAIIIR